MASQSRVLYTGVTSNLIKRVYEHKNGLISGFSKTYNTTNLVYYEPFNDILLAIEREKQIKKWNRTKKLFLIDKINSSWNDLSVEL